LKSFRSFALEDVDAVQISGCVRVRQLHGPTSHLRHEHSNRRIWKRFV